MANLRKYIYNGLHAGSKVDLYLLKGKVGEGQITKFDALSMEIHAKGEVMGIKFDTNVHIVMPDESGEGRCELAVGSHQAQAQHYQEEQGKLRLDMREEVAIYSENKWTWVWVQHPTHIAKRGWIGIWPRQESLGNAGQPTGGTPARR